MVLTKIELKPLNDTSLYRFYKVNPTLVKLSNWWLHFFNNDPVGLIPTRKCVTGVKGTTRFRTLAKVDCNTHLSCSNPATVAFYVAGPVNVNVRYMVQGTTDGAGVLHSASSKVKYHLLQQFLQLRSRMFPM